MTFHAMFMSWSALTLGSDLENQRMKPTIAKDFRRNQNSEDRPHGRNSGPEPPPR